MRTNTTLVVNPKGGSGKTTIAINLASCFAADNIPTTLMDYDPQGSSLAWVHSRPRRAATIYGANGAPPKFGRLRSLDMYVPPETLEIIDTPREISALGIILAGQPLKPPKGWAVNACHTAITKQVSVLDAFGAERRLRGEAEPMATLEAFRRRFLNDKHPGEGKAAAVRAAVMKLPAGDAVDLLAGGALYLEQGKVGVWRVRLERGAGFYFDACYAVTDFQSIRTILIDGASPSTVVGHHSILAGYPANTPLW
jgi:hypothetical protein